MKSSKIIISFFVMLLFLAGIAGTVSAKQYVIYHDDEIDAVRAMQEKSKDRQYQYIIDDMQEQVSALQQQLEEEPEEKDEEDDFYDCRREIRRYIRGDDDWGDLEDYLDGHPRCEDYYYEGYWDGDGWDDYLHDGYDDWHDDWYHDHHYPGYWLHEDDWYDDQADMYEAWYENCKLRPSDYYDNHDYSDYLKDVHWRGKCKRFWESHRWYDYDTFVEKYENIDTSVDPLWNEYTWEHYYSRHPWYEDKME